MDVKDYGKRLSQHRENFHRAREEQRENYNRELSELKDTQEYRLNKQRKAYDNSIDKLEERQDYFRETSTADTKKKIEAQQKDYLSKLDTNKREFERDRKDIRDNFNNRFNNIRDAYESKGKADMSNMSHRLDSNQRRFENTIDKMEDHFNQKVNDVYANARDTAHEHELDTKNDRRRLIASFENEVRDNNKAHGDERSKLYEEFNEDVTNLRKTHKEREASLKDYQDRRIEDFRQHKDQQLADNQKSFKASIEDINDRNSRKRRLEQRDNKQATNDIKNQYARSLDRTKREMNQKLSGGNREDIFNDKLEHTKRGFESRIKNIYDQIEDDRFQADIQDRRRNQSTKESLRSQKQKASNYIAALEKDIAEFKSDKISEINIEVNNDIEELHDNYKRKLRSKDVDAYNQQEYNKQISEKQRNQFSETIQKINDRNTEAVSQMQEDFSAESKEFIQDTRFKHAKEMKEMKEHFLDNKSKLTRSMTQKIEQLEEQNKKLITSYEGKLNRLKKANAKEIERIKTTNHLQAEHLKEQTHNTIALKERENQSHLAEVRGDFEKRLSQVKQRADIQVKRMVDYYENMLERERDESQRKYLSKTTELENRYNTLYENSKLERRNLINQYENRIEEVRAANAVALEERSKEISSGMFAEQQASRKA